MKNKIYIFLSLFFIFSTPSQTMANPAIPDQLKPWVPWVSEGNEFVACPFINAGEYAQQSAHVCAWASPLKLSANKQGATFNQQWTVYAKSYVPLPGNALTWPHKVKVGQTPVPVIERSEQPMIELEAGVYQIEGEFYWQDLPESISVPAITSFIHLEVDGKTVEFPKIENQELWFQQSQINQQQDNLDLSVARKVSDGEYIELDTYIRLNVSGKMREVSLGKVLPEGFKLVGIKSDMPAFLDAEGILHAKLKPGDWELNVIAYASATTLNWKRPDIMHHWPKDEIWVFSTQENKRTGKLNGVSAIDSDQATMPESWYQLPSYLVTPESTLNYSIGHRGAPNNLENRLSLARQFWLSFDNNDFTFVDDISGNMIKDWRISMQTPFNLESAEDKDGAILITSLKELEKGFETRYAEIGIETRGKVPALSTIPVTGYSHDFEKASVSLHLPPGHTLFAVFGADYVSSSWWSNWSIWSSFVVLLASITAARLIGLVHGITTAVTLICIFQLDSAPLIAMLNLLLAFAARKHLNFNSLKSFITAYWWVSIGLATTAILYFSASQLRTAVYPQLEAHNAFNPVNNYGNHKDASVSIMRPDSLSPPPPTSSYRESDLEMVSVSGVRLREKDKFIERYQTDSLMQAGSGIPNWQWKNHSIRWNSPVASGQEFTLVVLGLTANRILKVAGIALSIFWLYLILRPNLGNLFNKLPLRTVATMILVVMLIPSYSPQASAAEFPSQAMLEQLKNKLLQAPDCIPHCASINQLYAEMSSDRLRLEFNIQAHANTVVVLPKSDYWRPEKLVLNDDDVTALVKKDGWIYLPVKHGISKLSVIGQLVAIDEIQIEFSDIPKYVNTSPSDNWDFIGLQKHKLSGNTLTLVRKNKTEQASNSNLSRYSAQPLVKVSRSISFDQIWRVSTAVERIAPATGSITIDIPTLTNELITSSGFNKKEQAVSITIAAGEEHSEWNSILTPTTNLLLLASSDSSIIEHWSLVLSPSWHSKMQGVPQVLEEQAPNDYYTYHFYPYPGESLQIDVSRPNAVKGQALAIDSAQLNIEQGTRTTTLALGFTYRSTRASEHTITLPSEFELTEVEIDGDIINLQSEQSSLNVPILPGEHVVNISMRSNQTIESVYTIPSFDLHAPLSNVTTKIHVNKQRWVLWANGPTLGPAVLYWGELLVFVLLALLLSRFTFSPLTTFNWIILGLGLSLNNWIVLILVVAWFGAVYASQYRTDSMPVKRFNSLQLLLYILSALAVLSLISIVPISLLGSPSMGIEGNYSSNSQLIWFADKTAGSLPEIVIWSVPIWIYKALMLIWVIWLSFSLLDWIKWSWKKLGIQSYWKKESVIQTSEALIEKSD